MKIEFFADNHAWIESKLFAGTDADFFAIVGTRTRIEVAVGYVGVRSDGFGGNNEIGSSRDVPVGGAGAGDSTERMAEGDFTTVSGRTVWDVESSIGV